MKSTCSEKSDNVRKSDQFQKINGAEEEIVIKYEKQLNNSLKQLKKQRKMNDKIVQKLKSTGSQPARLYGVANVPKKDTALRLDFRYLVAVTKTITSLWYHFPTNYRLQTEANTQDDRIALESLSLSNITRR